jgi:5-deoxy-glucuronate isomerase
LLIVRGDAAARGPRGGARLNEFLLERGRWEAVTPEAAGWRYLSFRIATASYAASTGDEELALVPLVGRCRIEADGTTWELGGRSTVFEGMP